MITRYAYLLILIVTVALTWETDVNGIIAYASRAFAIFYMLQARPRRSLLGTVIEQPRGTDRSLMLDLPV
jgi:hypothetical protein